MPPKKEITTPKKEYKDVATNTPTSGTGSVENGDTATAESPIQMTADELEFVVACLKHNVNGGPIPVDCIALAEALGFKHPGSAVNKIAKLKKKFGLNLSATTASPRKDKNGDMSTSDGAGPKIPATPSKNRVTKSTRGRAVAKKSPGKKASNSCGEVEDEEVDNVKEDIGNEGDGNEADGNDLETEKEILKVEYDHFDEV